MRISSLLEDGDIKRAIAAAESDARKRIESLTPAQKDVLPLIIDGKMSKQAAYELSKSHRTIEKQRLDIMRRLGVKTVADLVRLCLLADV